MHAPLPPPLIPSHPCSSPWIRAGRGSHPNHPSLNPGPFSPSRMKGPVLPQWMGRGKDELTIPWRQQTTISEPEWRRHLQVGSVGGDRGEAKRGHHLPQNHSCGCVKRAQGLRPQSRGTRPGSSQYAQVCCSLRQVTSWGLQRGLSQKSACLGSVRTPVCSLEPV